MAEIYIDRLNQILQGVLLELVTDDYISKLLYYKDESENDIYTMPTVENPIKQLYRIKVFKNKKVTNIILESDVYLFVTLYNYKPYYNFYKTSSSIDTIQIQVGVLCHNECLDIANGSRDLALLSRVVEVLNKSKTINSIGKVALGNCLPLVDLPKEFNGYSVIVSCEAHKNNHEHI